MKSPNRLIFKVEDITEEYAIVARLLCPSCEYPCVKETQHMLQGSENSIKEISRSSGARIIHAAIK